MRNKFLVPLVCLLLVTWGHAQPPVQTLVTDVRWGGRTISITIHPTVANEVIAASATGGLFKSADGGTTWRHLDNLPVYGMMDVKYNPIFSNKVIATSLADTDTSHIMGIWISNDRGETWSQVAAPVVYYAFGSIPRYNKRFSGYGISFDMNGVAYVGTDYGIAIGRAAHTSWEHVVHDSRMSVSADKLQNAIFSVEAFGSGKLIIGGRSGVYYCNDMYMRRPFRKSSTAVFFLDQIIHGIARSPYSERDIMITPNANKVMVSNDSAFTFTDKDMPPGDRTSRNPLITILKNPSLTDYVDVYVHKVQLWRKTCHKNELNRFAKSWMMMNVVHDDMNGFAAVGSELLFVVGDGGVFKKSGEVWNCVGNGRGGYNALQAYQVWGQRIINPRTMAPVRTDYYFGTQDNNLWSSSDAGATWPFDGGIEGAGFDGPRVITNATANSVVSINNSSGQNQISRPNFAGIGIWSDPGFPRGNPKYAGNGTYVQFFFDTLTGESRIMKTINNGTSWDIIGRINGYSFWQNEKVSNDTAFTMYIPYARPLPTTNGLSNIGLLRLQRKIYADRRPDNYLLFNMDTVRSMGSMMVYGADFSWPTVYAFDHNDSYKLLAPDVDNKVMKWSFDAGRTWREDRNLTKLITENGRYIFYESPANMCVWSVSFNPSNSRQIAIGTKEAGLIYTDDGGINWCRIAGSKQIPYITSIWWDFDGTALISSYGRGIWRFNPALHRRSSGECISNLITIRVRDVMQPITDKPFVINTGALPVVIKPEPAIAKPVYVPMLDPLITRPVVSIITSTTRAGEMVVGADGKLLIQGFGFSAIANASIELNESTLVKSIPVHKDGTLHYPMILKRPPGIYQLKIVQLINNKKMETPVIVKIPFTD